MTDTQLELDLGTYHVKLVVFCKTGSPHLFKYFQVGEVKFKVEPRGNAYHFTILGRPYVFMFAGFENPHEMLIIPKDTPHEVVRELTSQVW